MDRETLHETDTLELRTIDSAHGRGEARALPRTDGGKDAWLVLSGCFIAEVFTWGT